jgi:hypothetical protein
MSFFREEHKYGKERRTNSPTNQKRNFKVTQIRIYKTISLPFVLYGCEKGSPSLTEACTLEAYGNKAHRKIFGPKKDDMEGLFVIYTGHLILLG